MKLIQSISLLNLIGFPLSFLSLIIALAFDPFAWGIEIIAIDAFICAFFVALNFILFRNAIKTNEKRVQFAFVGVICFLLLPTIALPFIFLWYELIVWIVCILAIIWLLLNIKTAFAKMVFVGSVSLAMLCINCSIVLGFI